MKIIITEFPETIPQEVINRYIREYQKKGVALKTEIREKRLLLFYMDDDN